MNNSQMPYASPIRLLTHPRGSKTQKLTTQLLEAEDWVPKLAL